MRPIDADELRLDIIMNMPQGSARGVFLAFIDDAPTIEAVPVVEKNKIIDEFYDEVLNFEDYIEPITDDNGILLYSGCDITDMIVKIKKKLERSKDGWR